MGGPRASSIRRIEHGVVCSECRHILPPRPDGGTGARLCLKCMEARLITVVMAFSFDLATDSYQVGFLEMDGMTPLPWTGRYKTQEPLYQIVNASYQPMAAEAQMERQLFATWRGMVRLRLTQAQYDRLERPSRKPPKRAR